MRTYDVVIVGGGPAGSSCAWGLRESGLRVLVLDRATFPRPKVCGGWITPAVLRHLEIEPEQYRQSGRILQPITGFRAGLRTVSAKAVEVDYGSKPVSYGILRSEFDHYLLERCGAEVQTGAKLETLERIGDDGWLINGEIQARVLVGAGGHFCPVAKQLGGAGSAEPVVAAQEAEFLLDAGEAESCPVRGPIPELYFCPDLKGYGWCFRKGQYLNVGLGRLDHHGLRSHVHAFVDFLKQQGRIRAWSQRFCGHAYLLANLSQRRIVGDGFLLVGDAAGLAYPFSGEGIGPAVQSGLLAARVLLSAGGKYERRRLQPYTELLRQQFRWWRLAEGIPERLRRRCGLWLFQQSWFVKRVVLERWFLGAAQT